MTIERIFAKFKPSEPTKASYDPSDPASYEAYLRALMEDAQDYENSILATYRAEAQSYFYGYQPWIGPYNPGQPYIGEDPTATLGEILNKDNDDQPNRSTYVSTDVRDAVMMMLPSLMRLFGASESPVSFVPRSPAEVDTAQAATDYVNYVLWNDNSGFLALHGAIKDALTVKTGFLKWWTEDFHEVRRKRFENVTQDQVQMILGEDSTAKVLERGPAKRLPAPPPLPSPAAAPPPPGAPPPGPMAGAPPPALPPGPPPALPLVYDYVVIEFEVSKPLIKVEGVPPEEMRLDRYARSFKTSRVVGHERIVPVDQLIAMGYPRDLCEDHIQTSESTFTTEPQLRNMGRFMGTRLGDGVKYGEWFIKIDKDGDGVPELRRICTMGEDKEIVSDDDANRIKFALFSCDPISHTIVGDSLADYTQDIQRIKTNAMRSILDSAAEAINPKTVINELTVTVDDALNDDLGAVIRTRGDPKDSVLFTSTPFLGQQMMPVIEMLNEQLQRRTGLSDAAKGLDPKALQSSTMIGVEAVINGAQERTELVARVLCETGFKDLFTGLYNEVCENPNEKRVLKIRGQFTTFDTSTFDASMAVEVNPNLGKGSDMVRMLALNQIDQKQQMLVSQMGINNPICGVIEMLNTQTDMLALANIKNVGRYFKTPNPQQLQAMAQQPRTPDPSAVLAQAQLEKVRTQAAHQAAQQSFERTKLQAENQFKHQQLHAKTSVDLQKLDIEAQRMGVDHHVALAQLASQLAKDQQDADAADQDQQVKMAQAQNDQDAQQQQQENQERQMQLQALLQAQQHQQKMSAIDAQHTQSMTKMAADHHAAMTGHGAKNLGTLAGALGGVADRDHEARQADLDRSHEAQQSMLDRHHQAMTTMATLNNQRAIAKQKPKAKA